MITDRISSEEDITKNFIVYERLYFQNINEWFELKFVIYHSYSHPNYGHYVAYSKFRGEWYYFRNGYPVEGIYTINNTAYGFDYYGEMIRNDIVYSDGYEYYVDANGKVSFSSGWRKIDGRWYYFGTGGRRLRGLQMINGKMYNLDTYY